MQKNHIKKLSFLFVIPLLAVFWLLYFQYFSIRQHLKIDSYQQENHEEHVILYIHGKHFGQSSGETKIYINNHEINQRNLRKWNDKEIHIFIRKPFTSTLIQLKKGKQISQYISIWNDQYLPSVKYNRQVQSFPILETYKLLSARPPILEIRGQNFGFRYQNQWLLFSRRPNNNSNTYFNVSFLENYRTLKISELQYWSKQLIRLQLPQEVTEGPVFLVRLVGGKLQSSNSLYIPAAPNRSYQQVTPEKSKDTNLILRLMLDYQKEIFPNPELWQVTEKAIFPKESKAHRTKEAYSELYQSLLSQLLNEQALEEQQSQLQNIATENTVKQKPLALLQPRLFRLLWPRNEFNQYWHTLDAPSSSDIIFPAQDFNLLPIPENLAQDYGRALSSWLLQTISYPLPFYIDLSYTSWQQEPPTTSRNQLYNARELEQFRYQFQNNKALVANYQVPHWQFSSSSYLSPYWKALEIYKQAVRELDIRTDSLPFLQWLYNPARPETEAKLSQWPKQYLTETSQESPKDIISDNNDLSPEQILLLLLRAMTDLLIPSRIVAGSVSSISNMRNQPAELRPYFWLEIYLPEFGWFQADPLAEILAYPKDSQAFRNVPIFWGQLESKEHQRKIKLAFFVLQETWRSFDSNFYLSPTPPGAKRTPLFTWRIHQRSLKE